MSSALLEKCLGALPSRYPGPGGAAAVIHRGEVVASRSWGFANAEMRLRFTPRTQFRMCSITKQFTCLLLDQWLSDHGEDRTRLDAAISARLPRLEEAPPGIMDLAHNQSGLRDYWAIAMLHGAPTESIFGPCEAKRLISGTRHLHFRPGTSYSYVNQNFRLISDILEEETGRSFAELLSTRIFGRCGMDHAFLAANTAALPDGTQGYEGNEASGYRPAENAILWTGDAGLGASLEDMIAWERAIDAQRDDPDGFYNRLSRDVTFSDGTPARYGFGLQRGHLHGRAMTGHGGALRGWRSHRLHLAQERLSVVVMFNHMSDAHLAAAELAAAALDLASPSPAPSGGRGAFSGAFLDEETGLSASIAPSRTPDGCEDGRLALRYAWPPETLDDWDAAHAGRHGTRLALQGSDVRMIRPQENRTISLRRLMPPSGRTDLDGLYFCEELDTGITIAVTSGTPYGAASGALGAGRMERLLPLGEDVWLMPCLRALDHSPPGYWTLVFHRAPDGRVEALTVGCWLARALRYRRMTAHAAPA
ncbi:D-aminopeptidase [Swaminathania salitolerans]|uniref:D-aminopeptidase n=1 Tax=Swaminathania salitolerans TaxID=182838 RepID=A0A511BSH8_9PROT|nr:D-aminopeptidase [Swaminathania salitolerans]GBQ09664.1 D-aminopeptidase [Swaminathania salitolerans LMG 21291]GEL00888.1 D-aminopeptidase [Swaminathania salitolerans]